MNARNSIRIGDVLFGTSSFSIQGGSPHEHPLQLHRTPAEVALQGQSYPLLSGSLGMWNDYGAAAEGLFRVTEAPKYEEVREDRTARVSRFDASSLDEAREIAGAPDNARVKREGSVLWFYWTETQHELISPPQTEPLTAAEEDEWLAHHGWAVTRHGREDRYPGYAFIVRINREQQTLAKEPWEMTREEFISTEPEIPFTRPAEPRPEFTADHGMLRANHGMGNAKVRAIEKSASERFRRTEAETKEWDRRREAGEIPDVTGTRRPNPDSEADAAKVRTMHKRSIRKALQDGEPVPERVLKDYPELAKNPHSPNRGAIGQRTSSPSVLS